MNLTIDYYDKNSKGIIKQYNSIELFRLHSELLDFFKGCNTLLEIGSGSGRDMNLLLMNGFDVIGIEGSKGMIHEALNTFQDLKGRMFLAELPDQLPVFDYRFDGLYSIATLMHFEFEKLNVLLKNINSLIQSSSPVFFSVSGKRNDLAFLDDRFYNELNKEEWKNVFTLNGFEVLNIETNNDLMGRPFKWFSFYLKTK